MGTDAYTQEELERAVEELRASFLALSDYVRRKDWAAYRMRMRVIDLQYRQLRSQGPGLGAEPTRQ